MKDLFKTEQHPTPSMEDAFIGLIERRQLRRGLAT
jgi:hypothetical protein